MLAVPIVIGFDLDMTLIDSRPGIAATYRALSLSTGFHIDADLAAGRLGPPLDEELARWFPAERVAAAGDEFRALYPTHAVTACPALPGAEAALAAVRMLGGQVAVITGKYEPNARRHLDHLGFAVDILVGWCWAETKTLAFATHGVQIYVGDHPADMAAAASNGTIAVGVTTGGWSAEELRAAGADVVLADLTEFAAWLGTYRGAASNGDISVGSAVGDG